ncbi:hypothetical protein [Methanoculleus sp.]|uniref:hypothetical protein n=1 Tax=Methanoculleus sp. TaxID=90427 RepID=UPI001BD5A61E|nr:hypothetical protein [Methanoculleus sp.]
MVTITLNEAYLFFGAATIGILSGVLGNWYVTAWYKYRENKTRENLKDVLMPGISILIVIGSFLAAFLLLGST